MKAPTIARKHPLTPWEWLFPGFGLTRAQSRRAIEGCWLVAALALTLLFISRSMAPAFGTRSVVPSDARLHTFWISRLRDPELFRNDLIADYYQAVAPPGYTALYWALTRVLEPEAAIRFVPPLVGLLAALFTFLLVRRLHPSPATSFLATVLVSWYVWKNEDLASATPRAFLLPLLTAALWAIVTRRPALASGLVGVMALLYPHGGALGVALLGIRLVEFDGWRPRLRRQRSAWLAFAAAGALVGFAVLATRGAEARFGPVVTGDQARTMPEFGPDGRNAFFTGDAYQYWLADDRSGLDLRVIDPLRGNVPVLFEYAALAALLPLLVIARAGVPSARRLNHQSGILAQLLVASLALFFLAHLLLFRLHLPNRYVKLSLPFVLGVAAALALGIVFEELARSGRIRRGLLAGGVAASLGIGLVAYPGDYYGHYISDSHPRLSAYLRTQPKDILIAGVPSETDSLASFGGRSILVSRKHALAYHLGFYSQMRQRTDDLIDAYYAESLQEVIDFAARYGIDVFLVNENAFDPVKFIWTWESSGDWEPFTSRVVERMAQSRQFALLAAAGRCTVFRDSNVAVVPTDCLRDG